GFGVVPWLPSRAHNRLSSALRIDLESSEDRIADAALERTEGFLSGLALSDLAVVIGAPLTVKVADLGDSRHVDRVVEASVAATRKPVNLARPRGHLDWRGAVVGGEAIRRGKPCDIADVADHLGGHDGADSEDLRQGCLGRRDHLGDAPFRLAHLLVDAAKVLQHLETEFLACGSDRLGLV